MIKKIIISLAIAACLGSAIRRLVYIGTHYTLKTLVEHEKNH